ncbi:dihydroneopterin aldolase [Pedobacter hiemivivus]|uniref:Dihydroneopterin aldolase n=1 Tax=Pedobacter hiemivivus TaxID=2530454 RepID=A0A4R0MXM8_9SPHI|nr:dihydroneopterin aldolase [Pedobacter hiemivivus]TCC91022.1 dihydroneopterin aldolase [Pedobacter hiemivivus]TKC64037.1 dihydroneopterin aldolase [Pedobacter hiemivivus]
MSQDRNYIQTVALKDVKCFALHGYYSEEQLTGIYFMVDVVVEFAPFGDTENLQHTVNYEVLNTIILEEMAKTQKMLETVIKNIIDRSIDAYPFVLTATVGIRKLNPPMPGEVGHSFVQLSYKA